MTQDEMNQHFDLVNARMQLRAFWLLVGFCPCGADNKKPHVPACPTAQALEYYDRGKVAINELP